MTAARIETRRPPQEAGASRTAAGAEKPDSETVSAARSHTTFVGGIRCVIHTEQPEWHVREVSRLADGLMRQVRDANPRLTAERVAVLALMNACDLLLEREKDLETPRPAPSRRPVRRARVAEDNGRQMSIYDYELPSWRPIEDVDASR